MGYDAVSKVLGDLLDKEQIMSLVNEFEERRTKEAVFAYHCDKLECDLQSKLYDEEDTVDLNDQNQDATMDNQRVKELLKSGKSWSDMWLTFGQQVYNYDEHFMAVSNYAKNNKIRIE